MVTSLTKRNGPQDLMQRLFEDSFFRPFFQSPTWGNYEEGMLPLDISETADEIVVRASLPGFRKEDVEVQVENGVLSIKAAQKGEEEDKGENYYRRERWTGSLSRRVALPSIVSEEGMSAKLEDGVLTLRIPVSEKAKPKRIEIA